MSSEFSNVLAKFGQVLTINSHLNINSTDERKGVFQETFYTGHTQYNDAFALTTNDKRPLSKQGNNGFSLTTLWWLKPTENNYVIHNNKEKLIIMNGHI